MLRWYLYVVGSLVVSVEGTCETDYTYRVDNTNLICGCCAPGFFKEADCQETNKSAKCKACSDGEFSLYHNQATRCHPCTISCTDRNSQLVENCTTRSDSHCQCNDGYYMKYRSAVESYCDLHSKCLPGFYVQKLGTATDDTLCVSCPTGTFQDQNNLELQCKNCSTCSTPSAETQACTAQTDTECGNKLTPQSEREKDTSDPGVIVGIVAGVLVVVVVAIIVTVVMCRRRGCIPQSQERRHEEDELQDVTVANGQLISDQGNQQGFTNGQTYTLIVPNVEDTPVKESSTSRRELVERGWMDLSLFLQKNLPIRDWKFIIRELFLSVGKTADHVIEEHEANHQRNVREQIYCCLITFSQRTDMCSFDLQKLVDILSNHEHTELATSIQNDERFTVLFPNMSSENSDTEFSDVPRNQ